MSGGRHTLNLAAAVICGIGSFAALIGALTSGGPKNAASRASVLSAVLGTIGSVAWAAAAYDDLMAARDAEIEIVAS